MALYDPNEFPQEVETTKDFTLADVLAWARTKPADEAYDFGDTGNCAVALFLRDTGRAVEPRVGYVYWLDGSDSYQMDGRIVRAAEPEGWSFGAFAARLEKALA